MSIRSEKAEEPQLRNISQDNNPDKNSFKTCNDLDDILEIIGAQGKYQKMFLYAILSPIMIIQPMLNLNILFMLYEPNHWCLVRGRGKSGLDLDAWRNLTIPRDVNGDFSKCEMFGINRTQMACTSGWEYDLKDYDHTIPSDFNWVCGKSQWATWVLTANAFGSAIGTIFLGPAADLIGRKSIFFLTLTVQIFARLASLYVVDTFWAFMSFSLIAGLGYPMNYISTTMISAEISGPEFRAWTYSYTWMVWNLGLGILPWIAYYARDWYTIGLVTTVPFALTFLYCFWIPESPRWLLSIGKVDKVVEVIKNIARVNGTHDKFTDKELASMVKLIVIKQEEGRGQNLSALKLFSNWTLAKIFIAVALSWAMNFVIYQAITLNSSSLSGNQFLNFCILAVIEVPGGCLGKYLCDKVGRRWTHSGFFMVCAAFSVMAGVAAGFPAIQTWKVVLTVAAFSAKFAVTLTFLVIFLQATEIFPTPLRSSGSGLAAANASIIGILTPLVVYTGKFNLGAPWYTIAAMSVVGVISSAYLPETLNQRLPETLEEAADFGKGQKFWTFRPQSFKTAYNESTAKANGTTT